MENSIIINQFKGIDVSVPEDQMSYHRAADALNMIPDAIGQIRKRPGLHLVEKGTGNDIVEMIEGKCIIEKVWFPHFCYSANLIIDHEMAPIFTCATKPLMVKYADMIILFARQEGKSGAGDLTIVNSYVGKVQEETFNALMAVLLDGKAHLYTDSGNKYIFENGEWESGKTLPNDPLLTVPISIQGAAPEGGGQPLEVMNLLCPWATESFLVKSNTEKAEDGSEIEVGASVFYLNGAVDVEGIDGAGINTAEALSSIFKVEILTVKEETVSGEKVQSIQWVERPFKDGDAYNVVKNRIWLYWENNLDENGDALGTARNNRIGPSPLDGEDNVRITYRRAGFKKGFCELCKASCSTLFGVAGFKDRLFLGVGARVYYSELEDPLYIGDLNYMEMENKIPVMGISGISDNLVIFTTKGIYFAKGEVSAGEEIGFVTDVLFTVGNRINAPLPLEYGNIEILGGEIVYLSKEGVVAVTSKENYSERYAEHRSATINKKMMEDGPRFMVSMGRYLLIFCENGICWLLDENQPNTEGNKPYAAHQYEGYRMDGFEADFAYVNAEGALIVTRNGDLYQWMDGSDFTHYKDDTIEGEAAINAYWETPWITGSKFYLRKNFRRLGLLLQLVDGVDSSIKVEGRKNAEDWKTLLGYDGKFCVFNYGDVDYRFFTYSGEPGCPDIKKKIRVKKATRFKLRFSNDIIYQTLIINQCGLDYVQEG